MITRATKINLALFAAWFALVLFQALHHAMWRDEVRALSIALHGDTIVDMLKGLRGDGHPALWHLLLRTAHFVVNSTLVLPGVALLVATGAVALLIFRSPFPRPVVAALAFSALFSFEYAVMARNYGISALLLFLIAATYKTHREKGVWLGALLFLLANTNVFGALMTGAFLLFWLLDLFLAPDARPKNTNGFAVNAIIATLGIAACAATIFPTVSDAAVPDHAGGNLGKIVLDALENPGDTALAQLLHNAPGPVASLVLFCAPLGLLPRRAAFIAALASMLGVAVVFALIAQGGQNHAGVWFSFCVALYWIAWDDVETVFVAGETSGGIAKTLATVGIVATAVLLGTQTLDGARGAFARITENTPVRSRSADLARLIAANPELKHATLIADPDYLLEPLPYYLPNPTFFIRKQKFDQIAAFTRSGKLSVTLGEILNESSALRKTQAVPVVILLSHKLEDITPDRRIREGYNWTFEASADQLAAFSAATRQIARFGPADTDESFDVYVLDRGR
jgi:hypothetical protein